MNVSDLLGNQVFAGVAGAAVVSAVLFQLKAVPQTLWAFLRDQFSATLTVYSEQDAFRQLDLWLGRHSSAKASRRVGLAEWWDQSRAQTGFEMTPGPGPHVFWEAGRPVFVNRQVEAPAGAAQGPRRQTVTLTTVGRSRAMLERVIEEARTVQDREVVPIHIWSGHGYELVERRPRRALESIILGDGLRERIVADAERFVERRAWYIERGIPHRRGYLFEGPPGTGKSSMALALAGALHRSVYIINPAALHDDNVLLTAINQAGSGIVLIEDIDAVDCGLSRSTPALAPPGSPINERVTVTGISASGLLNAFDGVAARDGRILIITSNHAEKLDPALIRPGRVDMRCRFDLASTSEAIAMFDRFAPPVAAGWFAAEIAPDLPLSQAEIQSRLLKVAA